MKTADLVAALITAGTPAELIAQVSQLAAEADALRLRRAADATRQRDKRSRDITLRHVSHVTSRDKTPKVPPTPPLNTPARKEPKKVLSSLPQDWQPSEKNREFSRSKGWDEMKIDQESERFRDHAIAHNRKQADWDAAWRNWVTSPYQNGAKNGISKLTTQEAALELARRLGQVPSGDSGAAGGATIRLLSAK